MEIWDGYFRDGTLAGVDLVRGEPVPKCLYHLVSEVLVRHVDGDYLLMQRDFSKSNYAGYYEATAGGSALKGEDAVACAKREVLEETGISSGTWEVIGKYTSENTLYTLFTCVTNCDKDSITLQEGETVSYKWMSEKEFISFVNSDDMIDVLKIHYRDHFLKMGYIK